MITEAQLRKISKSKMPKPNLLSAILAIADEYNVHRLAHVLAQVMHESGGLYYDRELWGPTTAQKGYEGRKDLGNVQPGDGSKFRGYGPIQVTGRANTTAFQKWCERRELNPPNFIAKPELIASSPWAGWSVAWYWETRKLNAYADTNDIEMITRKVNGGLNGYEDRLSYYDRAALVLLGHEPTDIMGFQQENGLKPDGISGPQTRAAMHKALVALTPGEWAKTSVKAAPVTETVETKVDVQVPVPVVPSSVEGQVKKKFNLFGWVGGLFSGGGLGLAGLAGMQWQAIVAIGGVLIVVFIVCLLLRNVIVSAIKDLRAAVEN